MHDKKKGDVWSDWLLNRRDAGDAAHRASVRATMLEFVDRVLDAADLKPGMRLADIGAGDGLLPFRAIERFGMSISVVLVDISRPLLDHAQATATTLGIQDQCSFIENSAESLVDIEDASVDVVTTRSSLAYVRDKRSALREFHRILKAGGCLSMAEPIFRDDALIALSLRKAIEAQTTMPPDALLTLIHRWKSAQYPDTVQAIAENPLTNFSERDLLAWVQDSEFSDIHLELHIDVRSVKTMSWEAFLGSSPHPWAPSNETILTQHFTSDERKMFEQASRKLIEENRTVSSNAMAYISARKPLN